jgi:murein DD-endopeptidase MepM/ murein hydrolase activator NlpD
MVTMATRFDGLTIVAFCLLALMTLTVLQESGWVGVTESSPAARSVSLPDQSSNDVPELQPIIPLAQSNKYDATPQSKLEPQAFIESLDTSAIVSPYDFCYLTQSIHGATYGHMAIDISAGKGAVIKSPINGVIAELYIDPWGNTTIVIENDVFRITMLHGLYEVQVSETVTLGQPIGTESNQGYTLDAYGQLCQGRDCGYHTHLNIFDKRVGSNANPLELISILP